MKKALAAMLTAVMAASVLAGCGGGSSSSSATSETGSSEASSTTTSSSGGDSTTFTVALDSDVVALDPIFAYDYTTNQVINQITEPLLILDENNQLQPWLASSWEKKDDKTYVYEIRDDVNFSDGNQMTVDDVLYSLDRNKDSDKGSYLNGMYTYVDSIEQTGDWEITVNLSEPYNDWQYVLATTAGHIIEKAYAEEHASDFGTADGGIIGTGPFVYTSWSSGQEIVLDRNQNYWDKDADIAINQIIYKIIPDDTTRVTALQSGEVDFTVFTPSDMLDTVKSNSDLDVQEVAIGLTAFLAFNTQRAPFNDVNVRKAITAAIDLDAIQDNIVKSAGQKGTPLPASSAVFADDADTFNKFLSDNDAVTYDLDKAKEYLAQSEYPDGFNCTLLCSEDSMRYSMALYIQEALSELGINVEITRLSADEHTANQFGNVLDSDGNRDYDMIMAGWEADFPDMASTMESLFSSNNAGDGGSNSAVYKNEDVDKLLTEVNTADEASERADKLIEIMDDVDEDCPYIFLTYPNRLCTLNKKFTGFTMNSSWTWNLFFKNIKPAQ